MKMNNEVEELDGLIMKMIKMFWSWNTNTNTNINTNVNMKKSPEVRQVVVLIVKLHFLTHSVAAQQTKGILGE